MDLPLSTAAAPPAKTPPKPLPPLHIPRNDTTLCRTHVLLQADGRSDAEDTSPAGLLSPDVPALVCFLPGATKHLAYSSPLLLGRVLLYDYRLAAVVRSVAVPQVGVGWMPRAGAAVRGHRERPSMQGVCTRGQLSAVARCTLITNSQPSPMPAASRLAHIPTPSTVAAPLRLSCPRQPTVSRCVHARCRHQGQLNAVARCTLITNSQPSPHASSLLFRFYPYSLNHGSSPAA